MAGAHVDLATAPEAECGVREEHVPRSPATSKREREVFDRIAQLLFVSVKIIETHRTHVGSKLGCRNLREFMHDASARWRAPRSCVGAG